ncbi:hypothetical protein [Halorubrum ezzemoulense]|uniref:Uncharacterized protein n=1 Tax=Halorubrum ezzemoulense TaxID=337243 RepID=A0A256JZG2_HALEZ|nr:hypothetical protein [Halorubrum ezzemoulense]OYR60733.1 hypothetical protein DJ80_14670 [Halorubrum ezzemoulense]OYR74181.1 hypothetical protein DJ76_06575 [Halorubrum ezzemoulense]
MSDGSEAHAPTRRSSVGTLLLSRVLITWAEFLVVGFGGAVAGGAASGPPQLVVYFATVLAAVAVFMFNVDRLVAARMREAT